MAQAAGICWESVALSMVCKCEDRGIISSSTILIGGLVAFDIIATQKWYLFFRIIRSEHGKINNRSHEFLELQKTAGIHKLETSKHISRVREQNKRECEKSVLLSDSS